MGYLVMVGETQRGRNNRYFDIKINVPDGILSVRVMTSDINFKEHLNHPVKLGSVSVPSDKINGVYFFNQQYGSSLMRCPYTLSYPMQENFISPITSLTENSADVTIRGIMYWIGEAETANNGGVVRSGVVQDSSGEIVVNVWKSPVIDSIKNESAYIVSNLTARIWNNVLMLTTTSRSLWMECADVGLPRDIDINRYMATASERVVNPNIATVLLNERTTCRNKRCNHSFELATNEAFPICPNCSHMMQKDKVVKTLDCIVVLTVDDKDIELQVSEELLRSSENMAGLQSSDLQKYLLMFSGAFDVNFEKKKIVAIYEDLGIFDSQDPVAEPTAQVNEAADDQLNVANNHDQ